MVVSPSRATMCASLQPSPVERTQAPKLLGWNGNFAVCIVESYDFSTNAPYLLPVRSFSAVFLGNSVKLQPWLQNVPGAMVTWVKQPFGWPAGLNRVFWLVATDTK